MTLKIFHTGDLHIGMKFNNYIDHVRDELIEARFLSLENMIDRSNDLSADIFIVAGDLFNSIKIAKKDIERTVELLNKFNGDYVLVMPGNHDYDNGSVQLWQDFMGLRSQNIILLNENRIYSLDHKGEEVRIYPAVCQSKHSKENQLGWIKEEELDETSYNIAIAHGALEGLSPDLEGNYYYMSLGELEDLGMDLCLLGHTHVSYPALEEVKNNKIFNAGTPEPDGLDYRGPGQAWFIELDREGNRAWKIETGNYEFVDSVFEVFSEEDLEGLKEKILKDHGARKILRLNLRGSLAEEDFKKLSPYYEEMERQVFHLIIEDSDLNRKIDMDIIRREFTEGSFPFELLRSLEEDQEAMQLAYDLVRGDLYED